ncbi:helix-turn-helix transcriptional regulator [Candidatus Woesebacteria bacterium]|nr:helix-turn-helix transcriptional regulator [Candidatus Woesebacteria bacterium]
MSVLVFNNIRALRVSKKITQEDLANEIGVTRQTIIAMEKGNYVPSVMLALKISLFFKKPVESIFTLEI